MGSRTQHQRVYSHGGCSPWSQLIFHGKSRSSSEEDRKDDCGADHHRMIVAALKAKDLVEAQHLMDHHLADIEGRVRLAEGQGDRHTFLAVRESFS